MQKFKSIAVVKIVLPLTLEKLLLGRKQATAICNAQCTSRSRIDPKSLLLLFVPHGLESLIFQQDKQLTPVCCYFNGLLLSAH